MKTVKLLGELGKEFGKSFKLDISNPLEAFKALSINFPKFKQYLIDSEKNGIAYRVIVGKQDQSLDDLQNPSGKQIIKIVPVLIGAGGNGGIQAILGIAIVALMWWNPMGWAAVGSVGAIGLQTGYGIGVAMAIGGVAQMISPQPNLSAQDANNQPDNKPSYTFNGAVNTSAQGYPVPVGYGRMMVGSAVISSGITVEELA